MWVIDTINSFKKDTWIDLFRAIEEEWILLWMWFVSTELELSEAMMKDLTYNDKIEQLKQVYFRRSLKKNYSVTDREVENAIMQSLQNSILWVTAFRKDCRYSQWLLNNSEAKDICQKYDNVLNPLFFMVDAKPKGLVRSIFDDKSLWLPTYWVKNWKWKDWLQRYRSNITLAKPWMYYIFNSENVIKQVYHPIVWYLLSIHWLEWYITDEFKAKMQKFVNELFDKQNKNLNKAQSWMDL